MGDTMNNDTTQESETKEATIQQGEDENEDGTLGFSIKGWKPKTFFNRKKYSPLTEEEKFTIDKLHQMGWSPNKIQKEIGIPHATADNFLRVLRSKTAPKPEPTQQKHKSGKVGRRIPSRIRFSWHQRGEIRRLAKKGYTRIQIAKELGFPLSVITSYVYSHHIYVKRSRKGQGGWLSSSQSNSLERGRGRRPDNELLQHQPPAPKSRLPELVRLFNKGMITEEEFKKLTDYLV